jgi:hypothetical protein
MDGVEKLSEVDPFILEPKSDEDITLFSKLDEAGLAVDMVGEENLKRYWEAVNM